MEQNEREQVDMTRRDFLLAARNIGAIGAVAVLAGSGAAGEMAAPAPAAAGMVAASGYHETEHIRKYYRCAGYW